MAITIDEYLKNTRSVDYGPYWITTCPNCGKREAYIFKDDILKNAQHPGHKIKVRCNRLNKCGYEGFLEDIEKIEEIPTSAETKTAIQISSQGIELLEALCKMRNNLNGYDMDIRGISNKNLKRYGLIYLKSTFSEFIKMKPESWFGKKYKQGNYVDRDVLIPIFSVDGMSIDRLLLRSLDKKLEKKEIQIKLKEKAHEVWNVRDLLNPEIRTIFVTEGVYDALSIIEVRKNEQISAISLPGVKKFKQIVELIRKNPDVTKNKKIIIAFDFDAAGQKNYRKFSKELVGLVEDVSKFSLSGYKDCNDFLQADRDGFERLVDEKVNEKEVELFLGEYKNGKLLDLQQDMHNYGYTWEGMFAVDKDLAVELFSEISVFALNADNSEEQIVEFDDILNSTKMLGVELEEFVQTEYAKKFFCK